MKIFDPYFTTKKIGKGTGLGLSMVNGIIKKHNGFIKATSKIDNGSTFQIYLPIYGGNTLTEDQREDQIDPAMGTEKIMIVDDENVILDSSKALLVRMGYKASTFNNAESALKVFTVNPNDFDLVITDMTMPRMTGDRFSQEILKIRPEIPIIICTGCSIPPSVIFVFWIFCAPKDSSAVICVMKSRFNK